MAFNDALRGYAHRVLERDNFTCRYCGLDGRVWPNWLYLSWSHLVPKGYALRDDEAFIVAACRFCNEACNRTTFWSEGMTPDEVVAERRVAIKVVRDDYHRFWQDKVGTQASPTADATIRGSQAERQARSIPDGRGARTDLNTPVE